MNNNLIVKEVEFNGNSLLAVKNKDNDKIYVGVNWVCDGLGLDARRQKEKVQKHEVFSKGVSTLPLPSNGGEQDTLVIELDFLPLWLSNINPKLVGNEVKEKLIQYQLKAKDILAKAFLPQYNTTDLVNTYLDMSEEDRAILYFTALKDNKLLKPKADKFDWFLGTDSTHTFTDTAKIISTRCKDDKINLKISVIKLTELLRNKGILSKNKSGGKFLNHPNKEYENYFQTTSVTINEGESGEFKRTRTKTRVKCNGIDYIYELVKDELRNDGCLLEKSS